MYKDSGMNALMNDEPDIFNNFDGFVRLRISFKIDSSHFKLTVVGSDIIPGVFIIPLSKTIPTYFTFYHIFSFTSEQNAGNITE